MRMRLLAVLTCSVLAPSLAVAWPGAPRPAKSDLTLPPGAIARLGSTQLLHGRSVFALAYSPDGKLLATAGGGVLSHGTVDRASGIEPGSIYLWEVATGRRLHSLEGHPRTVGSLAFSADGKWLYSADVSNDGLRATEPDNQGGRLRIWDVQTGNPADQRPPRQAVFNITRSHNGKVLAGVAEQGDAVLVWQLPAFEERRLEGKSLFRVALSEDGKLVAGAAGDEDHRVVLWDATTRKRLHELPGGKGWLTGLCFAPDGKTLAHASSDQTVRLWDTATGKQRYEVRHEAGSRIHLAFSRRAEELIVAGSKRITVLDPATGKLIRNVSEQWRDRPSALSPDERQLATRFNHRVLLTDLKTGKDLPSPGHSLAIEQIVWSPDGQTVATVGGEVWLWNPADGTPRQTIERPEPIRRVAFTRDARSLLIAEEGKPLGLWDLKAGKVIRRFDDAFDQPDLLVCLPDGKAALSWGYWRPSIENGKPNGKAPDGRVLAWDLVTGKQTRQVVKARVSDLTHSGDGQVWACSALVHRLHPDDPARDQTLARPRNANPPFTHAHALSPDGLILATSRYDHQKQERELVIEEVGGGLIERHAGIGPSVCMAFSPDGRLLAVADDKGTIEVRDLWGGRRPVKLTGHAGLVLQVAFSPDSQRLASAGSDGTALVWDVARLRPPIPALDLKETDLPLVWKQLDAQADEAHRAMSRLVTAPGQAERWIARHVGPARHSDDTPPARDLRAVQVLERLGTATARALLYRLSFGAKGAPLTQQARGALERLAVAAR